MRTSPPPAHRPEDEHGFTLVELMVVVLIIAILIAIAIPTYLGARDQANDRAVQSNVRNAFSATRIYYNERLRYPEDPAGMKEIEPSLEWVSEELDATAGERDVFIRVFGVPGDRQTVVVGGRTATGRCFLLRDVMGGTTAGTYYDQELSGNETCPPQGFDFDAITGERWSSSPSG